MSSWPSNSLGLPGPRRAALLVAVALVGAAATGCGASGAVSVPVGSSPTRADAGSDASGGSAESSDPGASPGDSSTADVSSASASGAEGTDRGSLRIAVRRTSPAGARKVAIATEITGRVPQEINGETQQLVPGEKTQLQVFRIFWGDSDVPEGGDPGDYRCQAGDADLVDFSDSSTWDHTYAKPGTYKVKVMAAACPPVSQVTKTVTIVVK